MGSKPAECVMLNMVDVVDMIVMDSIVQLATVGLIFRLVPSQLWQTYELSNKEKS